MRFDKLIFCYFESKTCKTMAINATRRDSSMCKCFTMNKREYEAFLNVYIMSQGVLGCKYSAKRVTREWLYWHKFMV